MTDEETNQPPPVAPPTIYDCLRKRHNPDKGEWVLLEEVAPSTGGGTRYADAVAINLWSSRGHEIIGYEVKVSRADWLRELKQPEKAQEGVLTFCDRWFVVAPKGTVKLDELPAGWGLLEHSGQRLTVAECATRLKPAPVTRAFFASLVRRAFEQVDMRAERAARRANDAAEKEREARVQREIREGNRRYHELLAALAKVKADTGVDFVHWNPPTEIVKLAQALECDRGFASGGPLSAARTLLASMERVTEDLRKGLAAFEAPGPIQGATP